MNLEKAQEIVSACIAHTYFDLGLRNEPPPSIDQYGLEELIQANKMIKNHNETRKDGKLSLQLADRLIAALYALTHFCIDPSTPVVINKDKAMVIVKLPENYFRGDDEKC